MADTLSKMAEMWVCQAVPISVVGGQVNQILPGDAERWAVGFVRPDGNATPTLGVSPNSNVLDTTGIPITGSFQQLLTKDFGTLVTGPWYAYCQGTVTILVLTAKWKG